MSKKTNPMLERLSALYGKPDTPDPDGFIREFRRQLDGFEDAVLNEATDRIVRDHKAKKRAWPTIGVCLAHCQAVAALSRVLAGAKRQGLVAGKYYRPMEDYSPKELKALHAFTDAVADGEIDLFPNQQNNLELGLLAAKLRGMAKTLRDVRGSKK